MTPFRGRRLDRSKPVRVYRNLHRKCYSVLQRGVVVAHATELLLQDCRMVARAQREGCKNVHAFVQGTIIESGMGTTADDPRPLPAPLRYVLGKGFRTSKDVEVRGAMTVKLRPEGASFAYGVYAR